MEADEEGLLPFLGNETSLICASREHWKLTVKEAI